jgi:hypothetical protein
MGYGSAMAKRMTKKERWQKTTEIWWFSLPYGLVVPDVYAIR